MANNPEIILADEPTGNLDAETTGRVMDLFHQLNRKGATILIATHDRSLFQETPHRVVELRFGRIRSPQTETQDDSDEAPEDAIAPIQESER